MADMLNTGVSALLAFQRALDTTSHNIANANTDGYSRQQVNFATRQADGFGNGWIGSGVSAVAVRRNFDATLASQARGSQSVFSQFDSFAGFAESINNLFGDSSTGINASLQKFSDAIQTMSSSPTSTAARQVVLSQAQSLVARLQGFQNSIDSLDKQVSAQMTADTTAVNDMASNLALLNQQIVSALGLNGQPPNDLLDQRDQLLGQLAQRVSVTSVAQQDGSLNVFLGNGQLLVSGGTSARVSLATDSYDPSRQRVLLSWQGVQSTDITSAISGGTLGGLLQTRTSLLDPARNQLGLSAATLATLVNQQQGQGLDLNAQFGTDLFAIGGVQVLGAGANTGNAQPAVTRSDLSALGTGDYLLRYDGTNWSLADSVSGAAVTMSGAGTAASPFQAGGLSIVVGAGAQAGDSFLVRPTAGVVGGLKVLINGAEKLAAAAPLIATPVTGNTGTGTLGALAVNSPAAWVRGSYTLSFTSPSAWQATDSAGNVVGTGAYTAGSPIGFNGMSVTVNGAPATGDSFTVRDTPANSGDNRNALAMGKLLDQPVLAGGTISVNQSVDRYVSQVGVQTSQAQTARDAQQAVLNSSNDAVASISGVNLDEEAASLLRYQQAYQAAARVITVAQTLFDSLLQATQR